MRVMPLALGALLMTVSGLALAETATASASAPAPASAPASAPAWLAPSQPAYTAPEPSRSPWRGIAAVALLIGLGGFAIHLRSRRQGTRGTAKQIPQLRVIETARVGQGGQLVIAEVGGRMILLGVTPHSIRRIGSLSRALADEAPVSQEEPAHEEEPAPFSAAIKTLLRAAAPKPQKTAALSIAETTADTLALRPRTQAPPASREETRERVTAIEGQAAGLRRRRA